MNKYITLLFFLHAAFYIGLAQSPEIRFNLVEGNNKKPLGKITAITQDPHGYIWLCGQDERCLYRYDGNRMISFRQKNLEPNSLGGTGLETIYADDKGIIWIGYGGEGLDKFDPVTGIFKHYRNVPTDPGSLSNNLVSAILKDRQGRLWVGTESGLDRLDEKTGKFFHYRHEPGNLQSLTSNVVRAIYEDRKGVIWVGTGFPFSFTSNKPDDHGGLNRLMPDGSFTRYQHDPKNPHSLINNKVRSIYEDSRGVFWIGTSGDGLHTMDRSTGTFKRHLYDPGKPDQLSRPPLRKDEWEKNNDQVTFICEDSAGAIWIGTMLAGINRYDPVTKKITHYESSNGFKDNSGWSAFSSRDGVLWISTQQNNLFRVDVSYKNIPASGTGIETYRFSEDDEGQLWAGVFGKGLLQYDQQRRIIGQFNLIQGHSPISNTVFAMFQRHGDDSIWLGTNNGIEIFDKGTQKFSRFDLGFEFKTPAGSIIYNMYQDKQGMKWFSTGEGLVGYSKKNASITRYQPNEKDPTAIPSNRILSLFETKTGEFWVGAFGGGFNRMNRQTGHFRHYLSDLNGICMYEDSDEMHWAGTNKGLYKYSKTDDSFLPFFELDSELSTEKIMGIIEDDKKNLWLITPSTILKIDPERKETLIYGSKFGIAKNSLQPVSLYKTQKGKILVGYNNGFYDFFPEDLIIKKDIPIITTGFYINTIAVLPGEKSPLQKPVEEITNLVLNYNQNNFSFTFAAIDYRAPEDNKFFSMLENYDNTWREAINEKSSYYFNVAPGKYLYHIKVINSDGVVKEKIIPIRIYPPWWNTWLFRIAAILFIGIIFYGLMRWRLKQKFQLRLERSEKEKQLAEMRQKTTELEMQALRAQMNPHFIFNSLNSINRFILQNNKSQASEYLTKFSRLVRLILQNSQAALIPLESELESLQLYLELEAVRFDNHFDFKINVEDDLDVSVLKVPPLIIQPYAENAIWHGLMHKEEKGHLEIELFQQKDILCCRIVDDGIGRKRAAELKSKSGSSHKSMGMKITASRIEMLQQKKQLDAYIKITDLVLDDGSVGGTEVLLKIPLLQQDIS